MEKYLKYRKWFFMDGILGHFNFFIVLMKIFKVFSNAYKTLLFKNIFN